jgi:hypothetical protein
MKDKIRLYLIILSVMLFVIPSCDVASTVYETTGWITGPEGEGMVFDFAADVSPYTYEVTLSDLSTAPFFGFDFLFLSITTATETVDSLVGPGSFTFAAIPDKTYFANVFGTGGGDVGAGLFGLEITAVPVPPAILLLGSGLVGMVALRRRK